MPSQPSTKELLEAQVQLLSDLNAKVDALTASQADQEALLRVLTDEAILNYKGSYGPDAEITAIEASIPP
jgi:hypothetical protein